MFVRVAIVLAMGILVALLSTGPGCIPPTPPTLCDGGACVEQGEPPCEPGSKSSCYTGEPSTLQGACRRGEKFCFSGSWGPCEGQVLPQTEICGDEKDNDCDGTIDECVCNPGQTRPCGSSVGLCKPGKQACDEKGQWSKCVGATEAQEEICDGEKDEDCDGLIDEDCVCIRGQTRPCGSKVGTCSPGTQSCSPKGQWEPTCAGEIGPGKEVCDGKDNDCNGKIDDGLSNCEGEAPSEPPHKEPTAADGGADGGAPEKAQSDASGE